MSLRYPLLFIICLVLFRCSVSDKDSEPEPIPEAPKEFIDPLKNIPDTGPINFANPAIGQRSHFVLFEADHTMNTNNVEYTYHTDTLVVAVTDGDAAKWTTTEFLTKGSESKITTAFWGNMANDVYTTYLQITDDSIYFHRPPGGITFAFHWDQKFPLQLVADSLANNPKGIPYFGLTSERWTALTKNYVQFGHEFERLNVHYNYVEMGGDGFGYTYLYGPQDGLIRCAWVNYWDWNHAEGWDLIPR